MFLTKCTAVAWDFRLSCFWKPRSNSQVSRPSNSSSLHVKKGDTGWHENRETEKGYETKRNGWHQSRKTIRSYLIIDLMMKIQLAPICAALMCFKTSGAQKTTLQACRRTYSISLSASNMFTKKPPIWHKVNFYQIWIGNRMKPQESSRISRIKFWKVYRV